MAAAARHGVQSGLWGLFTRLKQLLMNSALLVCLRRTSDHSYLFFYGGYLFSYGFYCGSYLIIFTILLPLGWLYRINLYLFLILGMQCS